MSIPLVLAAVIAVVATLLVITRANAVSALLLLVVSLLSLAVVMYLLGAPFAAALEVIIYAGAIMVLFLFAVMMLNLGRSSVAEERLLWRPGMWLLPGLLVAALTGEVAYLVAAVPSRTGMQAAIPPAEVGLQLFRRYGLGVEIASFVLLAALIGALQVGRRQRRRLEAQEQATQEQLSEASV